MTLLLIFIATLLLAYANGANDNFKGVATLFGSRAASYRQAIGLATIATFAGCMASVFLAAELVRAFSGRGLVPDAVAASPQFLLAVAIGAGSTILLATRLALPVSTTHGLLGALVGAGAMAAGSDLNLEALGNTFVLPLLLSPVAAVLVTAGCFRLLRRLPARRGLRTEPQQLLTLAHFSSAGVLSFARGLNDTPKIVGLMLVVQALDIRLGMLAVALAMAVGGLLNARRVAHTLSHRIAAMSDGQAFGANLVSGLLVIAASRYGLPVSTTHVCVGAIGGVGLVNGSADTRVLRGIVLSWVVTLPVAAALAATAWWLIGTA